MIVKNPLAIGIDIVDICRFNKYTKNDLFLRKNFSRYELNYCFAFKDPAPHLAGIFAAKEAVCKSLHKKIFQSSIRIIHNENGKPIASLAKKILSSISLSISHSEKSAVVVAINYEL